MRLTQLMVAAARVAEIDPERLCGGNRSWPVVRLRYAVEYVARRKMGMSWPEIGRQMGLHHTSVMHGVARFSGMLQARDPQAIRLYRTTIRTRLRLRQIERDQYQAIRGRITCESRETIAV